jgi:large repetitive protein
MLRRPAIISFAFALVIAVLSVASPVRAAVAAPGGLAPDGVSQGGIPVLSWNRVPGATSYRVEISRSSTFDTSLWTLSNTTNRQATPRVRIPKGTSYWRVRAVDSQGVNSPWATASFITNDLAGPTLLSPQPGANLVQPVEPALLSWAPMRGATNYTVQVGKDPNFTDAALYKSYSTRSASYVVPDPAVATDYYWRVQATLANDVVTQWSDVRDYKINGLTTPVLESPANSPDTDVLDVVLDWEPVPGAKTYNLQISTDQEFNTLVPGNNTITGIAGTRYSPPTTLANDQYYWRVTPVDAADNKLDWDNVDTWTFRRHWPDQPQLEYPADQDTVGDPFFYQWTPVQLASDYRLELSRTQDFNQADIVDTCFTVNTTFVPIDRNDCQPDAGGTYYWRVLAEDGPERINTDKVLAEVNRFTYDPDRAQLLSPLSGAAVEVPTLRWAPVAGAAKYKVTLESTDGGSGATTATTTGTSWTPRNKLTVGKTYRWQVQTITESGRVGTGLLGGSQRTFTVVAPTAVPGTTPEPTSPSGTSGTRFPTLEWTPVTNATGYKVLFRKAGTTGAYQTLNSTPFGYPAGEDDSSSWLASETYEWIVEAYNSNSLISTSTSFSTFTITPLTGVTGHSLAMTGTALDDNATSCSKALNPALPLAEQQCTDLRATPVLSWEPRSDVGYYKVFLARDEQMTNIVTGYPVQVENTHFIPTNALIDSQAGHGFYWWVQPCKSEGRCLPLQHAKHAFNKLSKPVETIGPDDQDADPTNDTQANDITFTWRDYLATNQDPTTPTPAGHTGVYSIEPGVEARQYRLQVDDEPNFQSPLETVIVDQTTYTSYNNTYPEGPLYWRVQAIDGSNNSLPWSDTVSFRKTSPAVDLVAPVGNEQVSGNFPLRWTPLPYAGSYDVEVYRDGDTTGAPANKVSSGSGNSEQVAFSPATPLPASPNFYTWRVRPVDAKGRPGPWTDLADPNARFRVVGAAPNLTAPQPNEFVAGNDVLFTWESVDGASSYRFERRLAGAPVAEEVTTPALAWAPTDTVANGSWEWRVSSLDAGNQVIATSPWSSFRVDASRPTVTSATPRTSASRTANFVAKFSEPVKGVSSGTYRIYKNGSTNPLTATVTLDGTRMKATLNPSANLRVGTSYVIKLTSKICDDAENKLTAYSWKVRAK